MAAAGGERPLREQPPSLARLRSLEGGVEAYLAAWPGAVERQALERPWRRADFVEVWIALKPKARVVRRVAQQDAAARAQRLEPSQAFADQGLAYAHPLAIRPHGHGPEAVPVTGLAVDGDGREGDVADDLAAFRRHERKGQGAG